MLTKNIRYESFPKAEVLPALVKLMVFIGELTDKFDLEKCLNLQI